MQILDKNKGKVINLRLTYCADMSEENLAKQEQEYAELFERANRGEDTTHVDIVERYTGDSNLVLVTGFDSMLAEIRGRYPRDIDKVSLYFDGKIPYYLSDEESEMPIKYLEIFKNQSASTYNKLEVNDL